MTDELDRKFKELRISMRADMEELIEREVARATQPLKDSIGQLSPDGRGGTGVVGQIARVNVRVDELFSWKYVGIGAIGALGACGTLLWLGLKSWIHKIAQSDI